MGLMNTNLNTLKQVLLYLSISFSFFLYPVAQFCMSLKLLALIRIRVCLGNIQDFVTIQMIVLGISTGIIKWGHSLLPRIEKQ